MANKQKHESFPSGICRVRSTGKIKVAVNYDSKQHHIGFFDTREAAIEAHRLACIQHGVEYKIETNYRLAQLMKEERAARKANKKHDMGVMNAMIREHDLTLEKMKAIQNEQYRQIKALTKRVEELEG